MTKDDEENRRRRKSRSSFGWGRLESVGSLCTLVFLGSLCFGTAIEALQVSLMVFENRTKCLKPSVPESFGHLIFKSQGEEICESLFTSLQIDEFFERNGIADISGDFSTLC